jgi:hypothetical protein
LGQLEEEQEQEQEQEQEREQEREQELRWVNHRHPRRRLPKELPLQSLRVEFSPEGGCLP